MKKRHLFFGLLTTTLLTACQQLVDANTTVSVKEQLPNITLKAAVSPKPTDKENLELTSWLINWMEQIQLLVQQSGINPPAASRLYAYAGIAMYEVLVSSNNQALSFQGKLSGLTNLPKNTDSKRDLKLVLHSTLYTLIPEVMSFSAQQRNILQQFDQKLRNTQDLTTSEAQSDLAYGRELGQTIVDWARLDGYTEIHRLKYVSPSRAENAKNWEPTSPGALPQEPYWGKLRPFVLASGSECHVTESFSFDSDVKSLFGKQAQEVLETSRQLTTEQKSIAYWWADNAKETSTPPGHWISIANQLAREKALPPLETAQLYGTLGVSMADAFISCWQSKYDVNLLRPITYIRQFLSETNWVPLLTTPPFPEYPSGHSVSSGAAADVLTRFFGETPFLDRTHERRGFTPRQYSHFRAAAQEAALSRLYGGIHFRDAIENGLKQGQCVGDLVIKKLKPTN